MARTEKVKADAKHVENELRSLGEHANADRVARLRRGYGAAIGTLKRLHAYNMKLRKQLGLSSSQKLTEDVAGIPLVSKLRR